jgi:hypothetical protein
MSARTTTEDFWLGVVAVPAVIIWAVPLILLRTWILAILWGWYVVPAFGLAPLRMPYAFGLSVLINYLVHTSGAKEKKTTAETLLFPFFNALLALLAGWIGTFFI